MGIYSGTSKTTLLAAVGAENAGFAPAAASIAFSTPSGTIPTTVKLRGIPGQGYTGVAKLTYQRLNVTTLFQYVDSSDVWTLQQYTASSLADLLPKLNGKYGVNLTAADLSVNPAITVGATTQTFTVNLAPSLQYFGTRTLVWSKGTQQIEDYYPTTTLGTLPVPEVTMASQPVDFTSVRATIKAHDPSVPFTSGSATAAAIVSMLSTKLGFAFTVGDTTQPGTEQYDLSGFTLQFSDVYLVDDANSTYNKMAILTPPIRPGKQVYTFYLHWNE